MSGGSTLFPTSDDDLLVSAYRQRGRTLDDLPYTEDFEAIHAAVCRESVGENDAASPERSAVFHRLHNLRKAGNLPKLGHSPSTKPPRITPDHEAALTALVERHVGRLSLRDRLPYTEGFDALVDAFNAEAGLSLSHHDVWRVIARLAK